MKGGDQTGTAAPETGVAERDIAFGDLLNRLVEDVRALVAAEVRLYRAEATRKSLSACIAAGLILGAVTLAQGALIALLVGLILVLAPSMGTGLSVTIVASGAVALAALLGWLGVRRINAMLEPEKRS